MGRLCMREGRGGAVLGIVSGGVTFHFFLNGDAVLDGNMPFFICLYALVVPLKTITDYNGQNHIGFLKKA